MKTEVVNYDAVIADLEAKRAALDNAIAALKAIKTLGTMPTLAHGSGQTGTLNAEKAIDPNSIRSDAFFQLSVPEAIRKYLKSTKRPRTIKDIADALERGGITHTSKNFYNNVATSLQRMAKQENGVVRIKSGEWGLAEWYPGRRPKTAASNDDLASGSNEKGPEPPGEAANDHEKDAG